MDYLFGLVLLAAAVVGYFIGRADSARTNKSRELAEWNRGFDQARAMYRSQRNFVPGTKRMHEIPVSGTVTLIDPDKE